MRHNNSVVMAISRTPNPTKFQKTLGLNDFYFGSDDWDYPLGHIQMVGKSDGVQIRGEGLPDFLQWFPEKPFDWIARAFARLLADLRGFAARRRTAFSTTGARVMLDLTETNMEAHERLKDKLRDLCEQARRPSASVRPLALSRAKRPDRRNGASGGNDAVRHRSGAIGARSRTARRTSIDNLYVTDASFFPSIGAVNPTLTIIANALRVADHVIARLK